MRFARRVQNVAGDSVSAWDTHYQSLIDQQTDSEVLVLSVGDPDFETPQQITQAAINSLESGDTHYTPILGRLNLRSSVSNAFNAATDLTTSADNVAVLAGAQNALFTSSLCLLEPGDEVLAFDPMYLTYEAYIGVSGAQLVRVASTAEQAFRPNVNRLERLITSKTKAIAFSNPNNPSGVVFSRSELEVIAEIAKNHDLWVISDEVYAALTFEDSHLSIAALPEMLERTVTVSSLSKSHAMTGWRVGWMIAPEALIQHVENMALCMLYGLPGFVQEAAVEALTGSSKSSIEMRDTYQRRRDLVVKELAGVSNLTVLLPQAGMFVLLDVSASGLTATEFASRLYKEQKVSVLDGAAFGRGVADCVRLSFTSGETTLRAACERIKEFVRDLG